MAVDPRIMPYACDSHIHVFEPGLDYPKASGQFVPDASARDYQNQFQAHTSTGRAVVVTPRLYEVDNQATLSAIVTLGRKNTRGVAVLRPDVTEAELERLCNGGICGIRFTLYTARHAVADFDMVEPLAQRVGPLGWHLQLHWSADQIVQHQEMLYRLSAPLVFDHFARLPVQGDEHHPAFRIVCDLIAQGRTWVKLSGPYLDARLPGYTDRDEMARKLVKIAPQRVVWGSDWPHVTEHRRPAAGELLSLLERWTCDDALTRQILVDNPAELYGFAPVTANELSAALLANGIETIGGQA